MSNDGVVFVGRCPRDGCDRDVLWRGSKAPGVGSGGGTNYATDCGCPPPAARDVTEHNRRTAA